MAADREIISPVHFKQPGWPSFWGPDALKEQHALIRDRAFQRGFRQKPQSNEDLIFSHLTEDVFLEKGQIVRYNTNWREISDPDHKKYDEEHKHPFYVSPDWPRYVGCDVSGPGRRGTCIFTLAISPEGMRHVIDIRLGSWGAGPEFLRQLQAVNSHPLLNPRRIFVENNAIQGNITEHAREIGGEFGGKVYPFRTGTNKMDSEIGLPGIDTQYQLKRWKIGIPHPKNRPSQPDKKNSTLCLCGICMLVRDATTFTADDLKITPDTIAAQFIAKEASRQGERYSETSASVIKFSHENMQTAIKSMRDPKNSKSLGLPVRMGNRSLDRSKEWPFKTSHGPHPDPTIRHAAGTCAACDRV